MNLTLVAQLRRYRISYTEVHISINDICFARKFILELINCSQIAIRNKLVRTSNFSPQHK